VGFPGETHEDFLDTYNFLNELNISYLHVFTYSERDNTIAAQMQGAIPGNERSDRSKMLHILSEKKRRAFYDTQINREEVVLFESDVKDGYMHGFSRNYVKVRMPYDPLMVNETAKVLFKEVTVNTEMDIELIEQEILSH